MTERVTGLSRRRVLRLMGAGAAMTALPVPLSACGSSAPAGPGPISESDLSGVLPKYIPRDVVPPDVPGVAGSTAGYQRIPANLAKAVAATPGKGGSYTAMTPAWWALPPGADKNAYFQEVNKQLGATLAFQPSDGNTYADKLQAVLASPNDVPDWVCVPSWELAKRPRLFEAVTALFADLTPFLAGDKVAKYPNLANIPTDAWKMCVFDGKLQGLPFPGELIGNAFFHRRDLFAELGATAPTTAEELLSTAKALTDPSKGRYGAEDLTVGAIAMFDAAQKWKLDSGGNLVHQIETPEFKRALDWTRELFASGAVHPDAVAGNQQQSKTRFEGGKTLIAYDGVGGWHESLSRVRPSNPDFDPQALESLGGDGKPPVIYKGAPANMYSFIKKTDAARIEELLAIADYLAAPFGSAEHLLLNHGVEGTHFTRDANDAPKMTDLGQREVTITYGFLVQAPIVNTKVEFPAFVKDYCEWMARQTKFVKEPLFFGQQIVEPTQYASIGTPFEDLQKDVVRGRKTAADWDKAVTTWRNAGGDKLREFYAQYLDK
jgi:putative aldouronate transport system substrate-binding protein